MNRTLKNRIIISFSALFIVIMSVLEIIIMSYNIGVFKEQSYGYCKDIVENNIVTMDDYFRQIKTMAKIMASDKDVVNAVRYRMNTTDIDYKIELYNQWKVLDTMKKIDVLESINNVAIIDNAGKGLYHYGKSYKKNYDFGQMEWYSETISNMKGIYGFTNYHETNYLLDIAPEETVSIITPIQHNSEYINKEKSYLICDYKMSHVFNDDQYKKDTHVAIYDKDEKVYLGDGGNLSASQLKLLQQYIQEGKTNFVLDPQEEDDIQFIVVNQQSNETGWTIVGLKSLKQLSVMRKTIFGFVVMIGVIAIMAIIVFSIVISQSILHPLNRVIHQFNKISRGVFDVTFEKSSLVEINTLSVTADKMIKNILTLNNDIIEEHKLVTKAQLQALQHQINPHFLNNTLQSVKALAVLEETNKISKMMTLLGKILFYSIYEPHQQVPLREELAYVEHYIKIQNIRFDNLISYDIHIQDGLEEVSVPKLIIQPIVENCIEHAFADYTKGHIQMDIIQDKDDIRIYIKDNGIGMEDGDMQELNISLLDMKDSGSNKSIGLSNVNARIKGVYGHDYGIEVMGDTTGTSICIHIPRSNGNTLHGDTGFVEGRDRNV